MLHVVCAEDHLRFIKVGTRGTWETLRVDGLDAVPLYFHIAGSALHTGSFARERFEAGDPAVQAFFWSRIADATQVVERYGVLARLVTLLDDIILRAREAYGLRDTAGGREIIQTRITFSPGIQDDAKDVFRRYLTEKGLAVGEDAEYWPSLAAGMIATGSIPSGATALLLDVAFGDVQAAVVTCAEPPVVRHASALTGLGSDKRVALLAELFVERAAAALGMPVFWHDPEHRAREIAHVRPLAQRMLDRFEFGELRARVELSNHAQAQVVVREDELRLRDNVWATRLEQKLEQAIGGHSPDWAEVLHPVLWTEALQTFLSRKVTRERLRGPRTNVVDLVLRGALGSDSAAALAQKEQERQARERAEKERVTEERAKAKAAKEREAKERAERERVEKERVEWERAEKARAERERLEQVRIEKDRVERQREAKAQAAKERAEAERAAKAREDKEREERLAKEQEAERRAAHRQRPVPPPPPPPQSQPTPVEAPSAVPEVPSKLFPEAKRTRKWPAVLAVTVFVLWLIGDNSGTNVGTPVADSLAAVQAAVASPDGVPDPLIPAGYSSGDRQSVFSGQLAQGANDRYLVRLELGHEYVFTARCEKNCADLDLVLENGAGVALAEDRGVSSTPEISYDPISGTDAYLFVRMIGCRSTACRYTVHLYDKGPATLPESTLVDNPDVVLRLRAAIDTLIIDGQFLEARALVDTIQGLSEWLINAERQRVFDACFKENSVRSEAGLAPVMCPLSGGN